MFICVKVFKSQNGEVPLSKGFIPWYLFLIYLQNDRIKKTC